MSYTQKIRALFGSSVALYYPVEDRSGAAILDVSGNGHNGTYTGVDLANATGPKGGRVPYWDGLNDKGDIVAGAAHFPRVKATISLFARAEDANVWTDGAAHELLRLQAGITYVSLLKPAGGGLRGQIAFGGEGDLVPIATNTLAWFHLAITYNTDADELKVYFNGLQQGGTQSPIGVWDQADPMVMLLGAQTGTPTGVWRGWLAHVLLLNRVATDAEIAAIYNWS